VNGGSSNLTFVVRADSTVLGLNDGTVSTNFTVGSAVSDPDNSDNSETEDTAYVTPDANLSITASDSPDPVGPDADITYTVTVANGGPDSAAATLNVPMNGTLKFTSIAVPAGFTCTGVPAAGASASFSCTNPTFVNGASAVFTIVLNADFDAFGNTDQTINQFFGVTGNVSDPNNTNNSVTVSTTYDVTNANLVVTNSDAPDPVAPGATITYTQTITNNGPDTAANATFNQSTPAGTTFQSLVAPAGWGCDLPLPGTTGTANCSKSSMLSAETGTFTVVVNVTAGSGTISSTVTGGSSTNDPNLTNNSANTLTTIVAPTSADLSITKSSSTTSAPVGSTFSYTIGLTNNGPDAAASVVMTDALPSSLLFRSIAAPGGFTCTTPAFRTSGTITCNAATLASGASTAFTLVVEVAPGATGAIVNGVTIGSATSDPNGSNSSTSAPGIVTLPASADLTIAKTTPSTSVTAGSNVTYTITVGNSGPSTATNVTVNDTLPAGLQFVSATSSQGTCNAASPVVCNLGTLLVGANATVTLVATATGSSGTVSNTATATSPESTGPDSATTTPIPVTSRQETVAAVPTLSEWMLILLAALLGIVALVKART
jgi:uncharacterized repeat protein (TIGR01451 family)